ncbi:MAG TPA: CDP-glycerol glycerophosphotransferase family protein [Candidatus Limnocylindrales bacterium]
MNRLEYRLAAAVLMVLGWLFDRLPGHPRRVVMASPRKPRLDGNLAALDAAIRRLRPGIEVVRLAEMYGYGLGGKLAYAARMVRAMYHLRTAGLVVLDNAWLPVHVAPHPARTTVVQVWHAAGALKRFGYDTVEPPAEPERTFLHRHYDWVVTSGEASREPWSRALRTPLERVVPLGTARTDVFFDAAAVAAIRERVLARHPALRDRRVITYAPTFRGRGRGKRPAAGLDAGRLRAALGPGDALVLKSHPNLDPGLVVTAGFDVVVDPGDDMNELLLASDILITDYSSSIFEWALLRRPLVLLVPDLADYERDPGLYLDYRTEMLGTQVTDTDGVIGAIREGRFDLAPYDAFIARHLGASDGHSGERWVERFLPR